MHILIIGSGGREHALAWKLRQSPGVRQIFCAPGNGGIGQDVTNVNITNPQDIITFCLQEAIGLVVIGPETPLVEGLADRLAKKNIPVFGPSAKAAQLEGSKGFTKEICRQYGIPTADYQCFTTMEAAKTYIREKGAPIVIKADGLASGKGVTVAMTLPEALQAVDDIMGGKFGDAGSTIVVEEYLSGEEVSFFALCDGESAIAFGSAQDHKRVYDGDRGPNTGGMGTYSPAPLMTPELDKQVMATIIHPTIAAMRAENMPFHGVLFAGLMIDNGVAKLIEFNTRFGDPETQVLMMRLQEDYDLAGALLACSKGGVNAFGPRFTDKAAVCVVMAANGYPGTYEKGTRIKGLEAVAGMKNVKVFHAGTDITEGEVRATGGRVLGVTAVGDSIREAQQSAYEAVDRVDWKQGFCRRDIGNRAVR